jgi:3-polyprenyl-4-hydroxybenzoate decarboxylase
VLDSKDWGYNNGILQGSQRTHIAALEESGLLVKIDEQINKDTELMPLVRWQFRGLSEDERRAFMFTNVTDVKGRKYDIPVVVGTLALRDRSTASGYNVNPKRSSIGGTKRRASRSRRRSLKKLPSKRKYTGDHL